jgi:hypothetical protein
MTTCLGKELIYGRSNLLAKAREAAAEAEKRPLADIAKPFQMRCRGVIAYLEGNSRVVPVHVWRRCNPCRVVAAKRIGGKGKPADV